MSRQQIVILDGYNIIHRTPALEAALKVSLEQARIGLISVCRAWQASRRDVGEFVVVFDGKSTVFGDRAQSVSSVRVVYTATGETADARIVELAGQYSPKYRCTVVSDDGSVIRGAKALGAETMSVREFTGIAGRKAAAERKAGRMDSDKTHLTTAQALEINRSLMLEWGIEED